MVITLHYLRRFAYEIRPVCFEVWNILPLRTMTSISLCTCIILFKQWSHVRKLFQLRNLKGGIRSLFSSLLCYGCNCHGIVMHGGWVFVPPDCCRVNCANYHCHMFLCNHIYVCVILVQARRETPAEEFICQAQEPLETWRSRGGLGAQSGVANLTKLALFSLSPFNLIHNQP